MKKFIFITSLYAPLYSAEQIAPASLDTLSIVYETDYDSDASIPATPSFFCIPETPMPTPRTCSPDLTCNEVLSDSDTEREPLRIISNRLATIYKRNAALGIRIRRCARKQSQLARKITKLEKKLQTIRRQSLS